MPKGLLPASLLEIIIIEFEQEVQIVSFLLQLAIASTL